MSKDDIVYIVRALPFSSTWCSYKVVRRELWTSIGVPPINIQLIVCGLSIIKRVTQAVVSGL